MSFQVRLKEERKRIGLSQIELGQFGGVNKFSQSNYENGKRSPDARYLQGIASAGIDVGYVLTGKRYDVGQLPPVDADRFARVARFTALTMEQLGKQASVDIVTRIAALIYNYLQEQDELASQHWESNPEVQRVVRLVVDSR